MTDSNIPTVDCTFYAYHLFLFYCRVNILGEEVFIPDTRCAACPQGTTCVDNLCSGTITGISSSIVFIFYRPSSNLQIWFVLASLLLCKMWSFYFDMQCKFCIWTRGFLVSKLISALVSIYYLTNLKPTNLLNLQTCHTISISFWVFTSLAERNW